MRLGFAGAVGAGVAAAGDGAAGGDSGANDFPSPSLSATEGRFGAGRACARSRAPARTWWSTGGARCGLGVARAMPADISEEFAAGALG